MEAEIKRITVGKWDENCYLLYNDNEGWVIDPGDEFDRISKTIDSLNIKPLGVILTHAHFDHVGAVEEIKSHYSVPLYLHKEDRRILSQASLLRKMAGDDKISPTPKIDFFLEEMESFQLGDKEIQIIHTPGHTKGGICLKIDNHILSGDLIFENDIGRIDLPGGNKEDIIASIQSLYHNFKDHVFYPGHGDEFKLEEILPNNQPLQLILGGNNN